MAQRAPESVEANDLRFRLHASKTVFPINSPIYRSNVNLLAVSKSYGLIFVAAPTGPMLRVFILKNWLESSEANKSLSARQFCLPNQPNLMACNADGTMLAVNYRRNFLGHLHIYRVKSFLTKDVETLYDILLATSHCVLALHLLWNPVYPNKMAVILTNGKVHIYTLQPGNECQILEPRIESMPKARCGSWSTDGKKIVFGHVNGKLQIFDDAMNPERTIFCPAGIHPGPFNTIAVQWLNENQFAAAYLQAADDVKPSIYIIDNKPGSTPTYTNYGDICKSDTDPRAQQINFSHIPQWNMLLVTSANGNKMGVLGSKDSSEPLTWRTYNLPADSYIRPAPNSYPVGLVYDTTADHQVTGNEQQLSPMPMVHVVTTKGRLETYDIENLDVNAPNVSTPPPPFPKSPYGFGILDDIPSSSIKLTPPQQPKKEKAHQAIQTDYDDALPPLIRFPPRSASQHTIIERPGQRPFSDSAADGSQKAKPLQPSTSQSQLPSSERSATDTTRQTPSERSATDTTRQMPSERSTTDTTRQTPSGRSTTDTTREPSSGAEYSPQTPLDKIADDIISPQSVLHSIASRSGAEGPISAGTSQQPAASRSDLVGSSATPSKTDADRSTADVKVRTPDGSPRDYDRKAALTLPKIDADDEERSATDAKQRGVADSPRDSDRKPVLTPTKTDAEEQRTPDGSLKDSDRKTTATSSKIDATAPESRTGAGRTTDDATTQTITRKVEAERSAADIPRLPSVELDRRPMPPKFKTSKESLPRRSSETGTIYRTPESSTDDIQAKKTETKIPPQVFVKPSQRSITDRVVPKVLPTEGLRPLTADKSTQFNTARKPPAPTVHIPPQPLPPPPVEVPPSPIPSLKSSEPPIVVIVPAKKPETSDKETVTDVITTPTRALATQTSVLETPPPPPPPPDIAQPPLPTPPWLLVETRDKQTITETDVLQRHIAAGTQTEAIAIKPAPSQPPIGELPPAAKPPPYNFVSQGTAIDDQLAAMRPFGKLKRMPVSKPSDLTIKRTASSTQTEADIAVQPPFGKIKKEDMEKDRKLGKLEPGIDKERDLQPRGTPSTPSIAPPATSAALSKVDGKQKQSDETQTTTDLASMPPFERKRKGICGKKRKKPVQKPPRAPGEPVASAPAIKKEKETMAPTAKKENETMTPTAPAPPAKQKKSSEAQTGPDLAQQPPFVRTKRRACC